MTRPLPESTYREVVEALTPFAKLLEQVANRDLVDGANVTCQVAVNDIRKAVAALASLQGQPASGLSDFIRNATPERKAEVYGKVMERASAAQEATLQALPPADGALTDERILALGHRTCTTYAHVERVKYGFTNAELIQFTRAAIQAAGGTPPAAAGAAMGERLLWDAANPRDGYVSDAEWADRKQRAAQPVERLEAVLDVVRRYLPPDGIDAAEAMSEVVALVDPWPLAAAPTASSGD